MKNGETKWEQEVCLLEGRPCRIFRRGQGPVLFWGVQEDRAESCTALVEELASAQAGPFTLVAFEAKDWNAEFSPWEAPPVFGSEGFAGGARVTLDWLEQACQCGSLQIGHPHNRYLGGYSLSGLFSLWALYESDLFSGAACCSGSLWFPGWGDYAQQRKLRSDSFLYLSLGKKEERTRNSIMASVGEQTRKQAALAVGQLGEKHCSLRWEEGGHFAEPMQRMQRGFLWLLSAEKQEQGI